MRNLIRNNRSTNLWNDRFFDEFFDSPFFKTKNSVMRTDVTEEDDKYILEIDVPGFSKEDIKLSLENGYLQVEAKKVEEKEDEDKKGKVIRRERLVGNCSRCYYVGDIKEEFIEAEYHNGILKVIVPKENPEEIEKKKFINIK